MYPDLMLIPMREELTRAGIQELRTAAEVDRAVAAPGTTMIVVNSICGCAAGRMRPAVRVALQNAVKPDHLYSVFAGQDTEATERARSYFTGYPPSSPSIAILRDGKLAYMLERRNIETREAPAIAARLRTILRQERSQQAVAKQDLGRVASAAALRQKYNFPLRSLRPLRLKALSAPSAVKSFSPQRTRRKTQKVAKKCDTTFDIRLLPDL